MAEQITQGPAVVLNALVAHFHYTDLHLRHRSKHCTFEQYSNRTSRPKSLYTVRKHPDAGCEMAASELVREGKHVIDRICPYGQPGDRLWVRETFSYLGTNKRGPYAYRASTAGGECVRVDAPWKPNIHMPRAASRILLEIVSVRVERLAECSVADAMAEGVKPDDIRQFSVYGARAEERAAIRRIAALAPYQRLWESINGAGSWSANPWVWNSNGRHREARRFRH